MKLALVRKELREHWVVLGFVLALDALTLFAMLSHAAEKGGRFTALVQLMESLGLLSSLVAANRLFVREYAGRTQLFLEVLPIARAQVWATKWLLGGSYVAALTVGWWLVSWRRALRTEVISTEDALLVLLPTGSFMLVGWCFASMAGMLGRHRYTAWIALLCVMGLGVKHADISFTELPVVRLLRPDVAMAHVRTDWAALREAWLLAACFTAASAALALVGSGALASALAQKMTARERVFLFVASFVGLFAYSTIDEARTKPPFNLSDALYAETAHVRVGVLRRGELEASAAERMAHTIADDLESMLQLLSLEKVPPVFVLPKQSLDPQILERAELEEKDGIVLRASPDVELARLRAKILHEELAAHTRLRAYREDRHVLLDGFTAWWALRESAAERERFWLRAAASPMQVNASTLTRWEETQERLGECVAEGLSFATFDTLARRLSSQPTQMFARALFSRPPDDMRVLFERSPAELLAQAGTSWPELAEETERERQHVIERHQAALAHIAQLTAAISVKQTARQGTHIEVGLEGAEAYWALYTVLGPWARSQWSMSRLDVRGPRATLPLSAARGARLLVALETDDAALGCPMRVATERLVLP